MHLNPFKTDSGNTAMNIYSYMKIILAVDYNMKKLRLRLYAGGNYGRDASDHKTPQRLFLEVNIDRLVSFILFSN